MTNTTATERGLVAEAIRDYFEGWYDADVGRMERALHDDLVKRRAGEELGVTTKKRMLELTGEGAGAEDGANRTLEIEVHDLHDDIANATVRSAVYREYVQLVRTAEGWKVANTLWQLT
jgi:Putative lumazine-binding